MKPKFGFIVEYVKDIKASRNFYVDVFGLEIEREHPTYIQFETFAIASDEPMDGEAKQEIYWLVNDVDESFSALSGMVEIFLPLQNVPFGKVFGVRDPEGQPRYILELAKNRPSKQV